MAQITLFSQPHVPPMSWEEFLQYAPNNSIALDGFVSGKTQFLRQRAMANINHHEDVDRLATRCTSSQLKLYISLGMLDMFRNEFGELIINAYFNDSDQDVCLSIFALKHASLSNVINNPALNRLFFMEDMLDTTSGAYPLSIDAPILRKIAWVFEPYTRARVTGLLNTKDPAIFEGIVTDVELRIMGHITGTHNNEIPLDLRYKEINRGQGWSMVEEIGAHARTGMLADRIRSFVSVSGRTNGRWNYIIGKTSPFVDFDVQGLLNHLNMVEGTEKDRWGGGDTIGGSPRVNGSGIEPTQMVKIIDEFIKEQQG